MGCIPLQEEDTEKENVDSLEEDKDDKDLDDIVSQFPEPEEGGLPTDIFG